MSGSSRRLLGLAGLGAALLLAGCWERPPVESVQRGFRGTGMVHVANPRLEAAKVAANEAPESSPRVAVEPGTPLARDVYKNVKVLGDLDVGNFTRLMAAMTQWVSPEQGCNYCHKEGNFEDESLYTKHVARRMLQMTQTVNSKWQTHVGATGVTCYTCHRGMPVPQRIWFKDAEGLEGGVFAGWRYGQNAPARTAGLSSLPKEPFSAYLLGNGEIRVGSSKALPSEHVASIQHTEWTYALMMHFADSLGVNCTFCHNAHNFATWDGSPPTRATAWHGIRMVRALNNEYLEPLGPTYPKAALGPAGDAPKAYCATCHKGLNKPLYGAAMARDYPELLAPIPVVQRAPAQTVVPVGTITKVFFVVGRSDLAGEAIETVDSTAKSLAANPAVKVAISGYADKTGNADKNLELAKNRAFAVRDALKKGGVGEERITMRKPEFVIGGAEADARRVEIIVVE
jgi:photosynthetic reaction center cytochrome c subunit